MANLIEIFSSAQGEGKYVGCRQIFIRTADCNLNCAYCDTNFRRADFCNVETFAGSMKFEKILNPVSAEEVAAIVKKFAAEIPTHAVSFTGGEPLIHWEFIGDVAKLIDTKILLETNGTLYNELAKILDAVDIISMDIKMPSVAGDFFSAHREFLKLARAKDLYVKIVISAETTPEEFDAALEILLPEDLLILQPVTPVNSVREISARQILELQARALRKLKSVRVIPQTHKMLKIL